MERKSLSEEYCCNLLFGALRFGDPVGLLKPVWRELCLRPENGDAAPSLKKRLDALDDSTWRERTFVPEYSLSLPEPPPASEPACRRIFGKPSLGIAADAYLEVGAGVGRLEFVIEGEFSQTINLVQMYQQFAASVCGGERAPESLFWVLVNDQPKPPDMRIPRPLKPNEAELVGLNPKDLLSIPEYGARCLLRAADALGADGKPLRSIANPASV